MFINNNKIIFIILFIIQLINLINCQSINFNSSVIINNLCGNSLDNACDLTSKLVWNNNIVPSNINDNAVIDLSGVGNNINIYLIISKENLNINSITIFGNLNYYLTPTTTLLIESSNITVSTFNITYINLQFNNNSDNNNNKVINTPSSSFSSKSFISKSLYLYNSNITVNNDYNIQTSNIEFLGPFSITFNDQSTITINESGNSDNNNGSSTFNYISNINFNSNSFIKFNYETTINQINVLNHFSQVIINSKVTITGNSNLQSGINITSGQFIISSPNAIVHVSDITTLQQQTINITNEGILNFTGRLFDSSNILLNEISPKYFILSSSTLIVPSGYTFSNFNVDLNNIINISDNNKISKIFNIHSPNFRFISSGNLAVNRSNFDSINTKSDYPTQIDFYESNSIGFLNTPNSVINTYGSLFLGGNFYLRNSPSSITNSINNINTTLYIFSNLTCPTITTTDIVFGIDIENELYINSNGFFIGSAQLYTPVTINGLELVNGKNNIYSSFLSFRDSYSNLPLNLTLTVKNDLIINSNYSISFGKVYLNESPKIIVGGNLYLNSSELYFNLESRASESPTIGDRIYLFKCSSFNTTISQSKFREDVKYNFIGHSVNNFEIIYEDDMVILQFIENSSNENKHHKKVIAIALSVSFGTVGILLIIGISIFIIKRKNQLINQSINKNKKYNNNNE